MKRCPQCNRVETDEALKFCRVDGATLVSESSSLDSEAGTAQLGRSSDASEVHTSILPQSSTSPEINRPTVAGVYPGLGDKDKAFEWLEKDFQSRTGRLTEIRWQIPFEPLRDDPRLKDLLKRMNLPE